LAALTTAGTRPSRTRRGRTGADAERVVADPRGTRTGLGTTGLGTLRPRRDDGSGLGRGVLLRRLGRLRGGLGSRSLLGGRRCWRLGAGLRTGARRGAVRLGRSRSLGLRGRCGRCRCRCLRLRRGRSRDGLGGRRTGHGCRGRLGRTR
jgi:hypothetical protein